MFSYLYQLLLQIASYQENPIDLCDFGGPHWSKKKELGLRSYVLCQISTLVTMYIFSHHLGEVVLTSPTCVNHSPHVYQVSVFELSTALEPKFHSIHLFSSN
jgi:hypothetical protein